MAPANFFSRCFAALRGRKEPATEGAKLRARIAALEMDVRERDKRIAAMQQEYAALNTEKTQATASAGEAQLRGVLKRLAGPLSNLAALDALAGAGKTVEAADVLSLARGVEKELARCGLERVGVVGESLPFDAATQQRMSGGEVRAGMVVVVRIPGYRLGQAVLLKAMVSVKEASGE